MEESDERGERGINSERGRKKVDWFIYFHLFSHLSVPFIQSSLHSAALRQQMLPRYVSQKRINSTQERVTITYYCSIKEFIIYAFTASLNSFDAKVKPASPAAHII